MRVAATPAVEDGSGSKLLCPLLDALRTHGKRRGKAGKSKKTQKIDTKKKKKPHHNHGYKVQIMRLFRPFQRPAPSSFISYHARVSMLGSADMMITYNFARHFYESSVISHVIYSSKIGKNFERFFSAVGDPLFYVYSLINKVSGKHNLLTSKVPKTFCVRRAGKNLSQPFIQKEQKVSNPLYLHGQILHDLRKLVCYQGSFL